MVVAAIAALALSSCGGDDASEGPVADAAVDGVPDADVDCERDELIEWFGDTDGDGFGDLENAMLACEQPAGFVDNSDDCDDTTAARKPGGDELCDTLDNDCDGATGDVCSAGCAGFAGAAGFYAICTTPATFLGAIGTCAGMQMLGVRIDTAAENTELRSEVTVRAGGAVKFWTGGQDSVTEDVWLWDDGVQFWQGRANGTAVGGLFENWQGGEPNDDGTEDCLEVQSGGGWNDVGCGNARRFVCEVP